ncbi:hypothetical protein [Yinghuangia soli]|uniref:Uncharacterized protein n=1 Tax=Yinghuangia soli TaxID=2908204 RepID=A0AA41U4V0_9ACTN|nr:hypothetical protein [Yinghuangia soli]MCF2534073.1 hypothetical protein [Yinghuangia soli]
MVRPEPACFGGTSRQLQHVRGSRVLGHLGTDVGWQDAVWVDLALEPGQEGL